jgi:hypothetical protein
MGRPRGKYRKSYLRILRGLLTTTKGGGKVIDDAIVLWALLLLYALPIGVVAYWMEKKMSEEGGEDDV